MGFLVEEIGPARSEHGAHARHALPGVLGVPAARAEHALHAPRAVHPARVERELAQDALVSYSTHA